MEDEGKKNILIIYGGGGSEHDISKKSAEYFKQKILSIGHNSLLAELTKENELIYQQEVIKFKKLSGSGKSATQPIL